jgi:beta-glucosidase
MEDGGIATADAGLDVAMPSSETWGAYGGNLTIAVNNGSLAESRVTDMATRIVAAWYQMGQDVSRCQPIYARDGVLTSKQEGFPESGIGMPLDYTVPHTSVNARDPASKPVLLAGALEGHVLVKNVNAALPLKSPKLISIFGYDAAPPPSMDIGSPTNFFAPFALGYESQLGYNGFTSGGTSPPTAPNGTLIVGGKFPLRQNGLF